MLQADLALGPAKEGAEPAALLVAGVQLLLRRLPLLRVLVHVQLSLEIVWQRLRDHVEGKVKRSGKVRLAAGAHCTGPTSRTSMDGVDQVVGTRKLIVCSVVVRRALGEKRRNGCAAWWTTVDRELWRRGPHTGAGSSERVCVSWVARCARARSVGWRAVTPLCRVCADRRSASGVRLGEGFGPCLDACVLGAVCLDLGGGRRVGRVGYLGGGFVVPRHVLLGWECVGGYRCVRVCVVVVVAG